MSDLQGHPIVSCSCNNISAHEICCNKDLQIQSMQCQINQIQHHEAKSLSSMQRTTVLSILQTRSMAIEDNRKLKQSIPQLQCMICKGSELESFPSLCPCSCQSVQHDRVHCALCFRCVIKMTQSKQNQCPQCGESIGEFMKQELNKLFGVEMLESISSPRALGAGDISLPPSQLSNSIGEVSLSNAPTHPAFGATDNVTVLCSSKTESTSNPMLSHFKGAEQIEFHEHSSKSPAPVTTGGTFHSTTNPSFLTVSTSKIESDCESNNECDQSDVESESGSSDSSASDSDESSDPNDGSNGCSSNSDVEEKQDCNSTYQKKMEQQNQGAVNVMRGKKRKVSDDLQEKKEPSAKKKKTKRQQKAFIDDIVTISNLLKMLPTVIDWQTHAPTPTFQLLQSWHTGVVTDVPLSNSTDLSSGYNAIVAHTQKCIASVKLSEQLSLFGRAEVGYYFLVLHQHWSRFAKQNRSWGDRDFVSYIKQKFKLSADSIHRHKTWAKLIMTYPQLCQLQRSFTCVCNHIKSGVMKRAIESSKIQSQEGWLSKRNQQMEPTWRLDSILK
jgi:hypothetical protein